MERKAINDMIKRYLEGNATEEERDFLYLWLTRQVANAEWKWKPGEKAEVEDVLRFRLKGLLEPTLAERPLATPSGISFRKLSAIAAAALLVLGLGIWYFYDHSPANRTGTTNLANHFPLEPDDALVIYADGRAYELDSMAIGEELTIGQTRIKKLSNAQLVYQQADAIVGSSDIHRLYVPKGRDFNVTLPDGSMVWLNTESVLEFPVAFGKGERRVAMSGEALFEVKSDKSRPFIVMAQDAEVVATGTTFNVKAYHDEEILYTTLLEGKVRMETKECAQEITPNQQAIIQQGVAGIQVEKVNVANIIAKKNGYFVFHKQDISSIMKEVGRWYDVEVHFQGEVSRRQFGGTFSRSRKLSELLEYFESIGGVKFKQEGRRIIVMP